jgi:hypothetical protein
LKSQKHPRSNAFEITNQVTSKEKNMKSTFMVVLFLFLSATANSQIAQGPATGSIAGGAVVNTDNFEASESPFLENATPHKHPEFVLYPAPQNMPAPSAPEGSNYVPDASVRPNSPLSPPPITLASFQGNNQFGGFPPDPHLAVGPNHLIHVVNSSFRISDKAGNTLKTISANSWYQSVLPSSGPFDPKVHYDHHAQRWLMVWDNQNDATQTAYFLVSVSDDDNPLGTWFNWALPSNVYGSTVSGTWQDYQGVGYDKDAFYITGRHFGFVSGYFGNAIRILPKAQFLGATPGPITWTDFWSLRDLFGNDVDGVRPSIVYSAPNEYYFAGPPSLTSGSYMALYRITNPLGTPSISCVHVPVTGWSNAPAAGQLGGGTPIETGGSRIRHEPIYRDSSLWMAHSVAANGGYSAVRYVRINTPSNTATEDVTMGAPGYWYFYPALAVDKDNNIGITFSRSGESEYAGAFYTWRLATDPPGLRPTEVMQRGVANYVRLGSGRNRWGDYMGAALDPADKNAVWFFTEYVSSVNNYNCWVHGIRLTPYPTATISSSVPSKDFGRVEATFASDTLQIMLNNIGSPTLVISSITKSNPAFHLLELPSFPANVVTFDSLKFKVYFRPSAHGTVNDTIRIVSNDPATPVLRIPLTGKGVVIGRAAASVLYGVSGPPATSSLHVINTTTGVASTLGATGLFDVQGLAIHPASSEIYGAVTTGSSTQLYRISAAFGDAIPASTMRVGNARAIAFADANTLYAGTGNGRLYRVNVTTGDTTYVGTASIVYAGLSFNPITGTLWASVRPPIIGRDNIYKINTTTGAATLVGSTGGGNITPDIAFDAQGKLYGIKGTATQVDTLIVIDTTTAFGTRIGSMGIAGIQTLAMRVDSTTNVREVASAPPTRFTLEQNYPNPFNPSTTIKFSMPQASDVTLRVYDVLGREVATLVNGVKPMGTYEVTWKAHSVASGVYYYRISAGSFSHGKKLLLLR